MLFVYIHTHSVENCTIDKPQESFKMMAQMQAEAAKANIKVTGYGAPHEHTMYAIIEANDIAALEKLLVPMTKWGDASLIPVVSFEQMAAQMTEMAS
jgi:hypothetical protein